MLAVLTLFEGHVQAQAVKLDLQSGRDTVNVQLSGREAWSYDLKRDGNQITFISPHLEDRALVELRNLRSPLITKVEIREIADQKHEVTFTVKNESIQTFDYLTDQPSRLIIDFFRMDDDGKNTRSRTAKASKGKIEKMSAAPSANPEVSKSESPAVNSEATGSVDAAVATGDRAPASASVSESAPTGKASKKLIAKKRGKRNARLPASVESNAKKVQENIQEAATGVADAGDPELQRFDIKDYEIDPKAIIASKLNIPIEFPDLQLDRPQLKAILEAPPIYEIKPTETDENKQARLVLTLFEKQRLGLMLKTLEFFREKFPTSQYDEILRYVEADAYYKLWEKERVSKDFDHAIGLYQKLVQDFPNNPLAERTLLLIGYSQLERAQSLNVIKTFQALLHDYPETKEKYPAKLAIAQAYQNLSKFDEALMVLDEIEKDPKAEKYAAAAAYLKGDVYIRAEQREKAIGEYKRAQDKFPTYWKDYPNAFYNRAEALYRDKKYREALTGYREFLQRFPASEHGGYAMTRIGELMEILGAKSNKVTGAYLESIFRYRDSAGANFARIRLASHRMNEMKEKEVEKTIEEIRAFQKKSDIPRLEDFIVLKLADGYLKRKEYDKALKMLMDFYQGNPNATTLSYFKERIVRTITNQIREAAEAGDSIRALELYGKYAGNWLKGNNRIDLSYAIGMAFEKAGVPDQAEHFYTEAQNRIRSAKEQGQMDERQVFEKVPTENTLNLRQAAAALFGGKTETSWAHVHDIKLDGPMTDGEQVERVEILAQLSELKGDTPHAKKYLKDLIDSYNGNPNQVARVYLRLSDILIKQKEYDQAESTMEKLSDLLKTATDVDPEIQAKLLEKRGNMYVAMGEREKAITTYQSLLTQFEDKRPLASIRYELGKLQFDKGRIKDAKETWDALNAPASSFWYNMAQEQLKHAAWRDDYKKYIQRIPAMAAPSPSPQNTGKKNE